MTLLKFNEKNLHHNDKEVGYIYISTRNVKTTRVYIQTAVTKTSELGGKRDGDPAALPT